MERDPNEGGSDFGRDLAVISATSRRRRSAMPRRTSSSPIDDILAGQRARPPPEPPASPVERPSMTGVARDLIRPAFRPVGTHGLPLESFDRETLAAALHAESRAAAPRHGPGRPAGGLRDPGRWLRHRRQRRPPAVVGHRAGRAAGRRNAQPRRLGGDRALDQRGLGRAPRHQLRYGRRPRCGADPPARRGHYLARSSGRAGACSWASRTATCSPQRRLRRATRASSRCSASSSSSSRVGRTSRSTGGCSRSSTADWSSSASDRRPARRDRRAGRDAHAGPPRGPQRADRGRQGRPARSARRDRRRPHGPGGDPDRGRPRLLRRPGPRGARLPDAAPLDVELRERYNPIIRALRSMGQPVIAAVNGVAAGRRRVAGLRLRPSDRRRRMRGSCWRSGGSGWCPTAARRGSCRGSWARPSAAEIALGRRPDLRRGSAADRPRLERRAGGRR